MNEEGTATSNLHETREYAPVFVRPVGPGPARNLGAGRLALLQAFADMTRADNQRIDVPLLALVGASEGEEWARQARTVDASVVQRQPGPGSSPSTVPAAPTPTAK